MQTATPSLNEIVQRTRDLLDEKQAAEFLGVAPGTLSVWRSRGRYSIAFIKVGHLVRYRRADLETWLESRTRANGATA
jgi:excisionase family DNA binding protein